MVLALNSKPIYKYPFSIICKEKLNKTAIYAAVQFCYNVP